jgi:localization factor PodJL
LDLFKTCKAGNEYLATVEFLRIFKPEPHFCGRVIRMSVPSPWSVKGVQPKTREAAKDLARREGLTLGEWLNRLIGDVDEDGDVVASRENTPSFAPQHQAQDYHQEPVYKAEAPRAYAQPLAPFPEQNVSQSQNWNPREAENSRLTAALEQLTRRLDLAASPALAPMPTNTYVPTLPNALADRMEASERRTETALGRVDASLSDVRQTQSALAERLRAMEANDPNHKSLAALRGLESALARLSQQVFDVEARNDALEGRIDEKLAEATAKLTQDNGLSERVGEIEQVTQQALETLDSSIGLISQRLASTEALAGETNGRLAEAMIDLSARLTGVEQNSDDPTTANQINNLGERLAGVEDITTQAIESVDKGLGLVSQRVAATEALAQATNERLVEALIDLSARLVQLETIDNQEEARDLLSALEAKNKELTRRLETLDNKIDATRTELTQEVNSAISSGVDGRMAEIAKALADRLDVSERRSGEALEKIGAEMARASISLDQRLREIEERGTDDVAASMRTEMAKMARAIDERMASMERRDATALDQAGDHIQQLAQSLSEKLDATEARTQNAVQNVSSQMEQLAQRLQARQDETAKNLVARIEDGETRGHHELQNSLAQISAEIRSAEDRAKAVAAPLHRDFNSLVDRLDQVEASGIAPYAENIGFGEQAVTIGTSKDYGDSERFDPNPERGRDAFGTPVATTNYQAPSTDEFEFGEAYAPLAKNDAERRPGFGAPFPGTGSSGVSDPGLNDVGHVADLTSNFDEDPFSMASTPVGASGVDSSAGSAFDFADDMDESWSEPSRTSRGSADYLTNARNAASRAAAENLEKQKSAKKKPILGTSKKKSPKTAPNAMLAGSGVQGDKSKPALSPIGMVAAAALVVTTGAIGFNYLNQDKNQNEMPAALSPAPVAVAPEATVENQPAVSAQAPEVAPILVPPATQAATPKVPEAKASAVAPVITPQPAKVVTRIETRPSPEMRRFVATENAKAQEAAARSQAVAARLKQTAPVARPITPPARALVVPQIATPQTKAPASAPKATPNAALTPTRAPAPRVAVAGAPKAAASQANATVPAGGGTARQLYDQAIARQQAGDAAGAAALMRAAADTGDARSINRLAKMYERGEGVARDPAQARLLTERAAARGSRQAMHNLGVYYAEGEGPQRDLSKAAENFRRAANRGVTDSQFNLGAMAEQGLTGQRSDREAYYWYSVAGRSGDRDAAAKSRELGARLPAAERTAEDQRAAAFQPEPGGDD